MGILELNEDGGGGGSGGGKGFVAERFLVGVAGQDRDEGVGDRSKDVDGNVDAEEDNKKWDLVGELVVELDCLVEQPLLGFKLIGSGTVITRLPLNNRRRVLLLLFNIVVEDPLKEVESRVAPATKAALP